MSDIDIAYPEAIEQSYSDTIRLTRSPLESIEKMESGYRFDDFQKRNVMLSYHEHISAAQKGRDVAFYVDGVVTFHWRSGLGEIHYIPEEKFTRGLLRYWFIRGALFFYLTLERRYLALHTGAVEVLGKAILFSAPSCGGKSTLTDYFVKQGHKFFTDDSAFIEKIAEIYHVVPSYPYCRPYRDIEDLGYFVRNVPSKPLPLHVLYCLERSEDDATIDIRKLYGIEKFKAAVGANASRLCCFKANDMRSLGDMTNEIPVYKITVPWSRERLREVYDAIIAHATSQ